jgi:hypothetical protein
MKLKELKKSNKMKTRIYFLFCEFSIFKFIKSDLFDIGSIANERLFDFIPNLLGKFLSSY